MTTQIHPFGTLPDGTPVEQVSIVGGGLTAHILTYGATVQDLRLDGLEHPLVLGAPELEPYLGSMTYFGAIVGRFANRIADGRFSIGGTKHHVPANWLGRHALHGGPVGTGQKVWRIGALTTDSLRLDLTLPDGDMGFPGEMSVSAQFFLGGDGDLAIDIQAQTDAPSPCSFAHHGHFNLDGGADITNHLLQIDAQSYLPVDDDLIPTGEVAAVAGTRFDFRTARKLGSRGIDHNFCLSNGRLPLRPVVELRSSKSGISMCVETTEPGLQIYDGAYIPKEGLLGLDDRLYGPFAGIAMETQSWPDAPNRPDFPSSILRPGETYSHQTRYRFQRNRKPVGWE
ncbi:MAG: aldose epimerase family protein [Ruegeria sp.]|nr:aldose epimerase family protein [Ruegeria sp.]